MSINFPTGLDTFTTLVDNVDDILAIHQNDRGSAIADLEVKVGVNSSSVATSHDYLLRHLPTQESNLDIGSFELRAQTFYSDVATGTAPFTVDSTTKVTNLNADLLDGQSGAYYTNNVAFYANITSSGQSISNGVATKIQFDSEVYDTNSNYDNVTNYRFLPTVAGYYYIFAGIGFVSLATGKMIRSFIYKNGAQYAVTYSQTSGSTYCTAFVGAVVYFNGSTDYVEAYGQQDDTTSRNTTGTTEISFGGYKVSN